jgi:hypothetical protein
MTLRPPFLKLPPYQIRGKLLSLEHLSILLNRVPPICNSDRIFMQNTFKIAR